MESPLPWELTKKSRSPSPSRSTRLRPLIHPGGLLLTLASTPLDVVVLVNVPVGGGATGVTVSVAAFDVVLPAVLLTTARNWSPLSAAVVLPMTKLAAVAPTMLTQMVVPPSIFCHWYDSG